MTTAIFGLVGVVVGALLTGGTSFAMAKRAEHGESRKARRLVADEVENISIQGWSLLQHGVDSGIVARPDFWPEIEWEKYKSVLAGCLSEDVWNRLTTFYFFVRSGRDVLRTHPDGELYGDTRDVLEDLVRDARAAQAALGRPSQAHWGVPSPQPSAEERSS